MPRPFRIFISSSGDVKPERQRAALVVRRLQREFARFFTLEPVLWEEQAMLSSGHFQDIIVPPSQTEVLVLILWSRLGTPLPERTRVREYRGLDGRSPVTGTEWEFEEALGSNRARGVPDLLVYRKSSPPQVSFTDKAALLRIEAQWDALEAFWKRHFVAGGGGFKKAFNSFDNLDGFEAKLEKHLREILRQHLPRATRKQTGDDTITWHHGSPFRGLQVFEFEHAPIFFGRDRAEQQVIENLSREALTGCAFLMVLGASGGGKSSLIRAAVIPDLMTPGVVDGVDAWRRAIVRPSDATGLYEGLASALLQPEALPELAEIGREGLAHQLAAGYPVAWPSLRAGLKRAGEMQAKGGIAARLRLILLVDQLEELFTQKDKTQSAGFIALLDALARSGAVWVLATLRSDFYARLTEAPTLFALAENRQYHLPPPQPAEIEQMIRLPAQAAGIGFERDALSDVGLDALLRDEVASDPHALPLLEFALDRLYREDIEGLGGSQLTLACYHALGGLKGAIGTHAEACCKTLDPTIAAELPPLLLALVRVDQDLISARSVAREAIDTGPARATLIDHLIQHRLLGAHGDRGASTVRLAHEALLQHWPRLKQLIAGEDDFLRGRERVETAAAHWRAKRRLSDYLIPAGRPLAEAQALLDHRRSDLAAELIEFFEASLDAQRQRLAVAENKRRRQLRRARIAAVVMSVLAVVAVGVGYVAEQRKAVVEQQKSELANTLAQSDFLQGSALIEQNQTGQGLAYLARAIRTTGHIPSATRAANLLSYGTHKLSPSVMWHESWVDSAAFSPDGLWVVTTSIDYAQVWDAATGEPMGTPLLHEDSVSSAAFSPDGRWVLTASWDQSARLWNANTGEPVGVPLHHEDDVNSAAFSPNGQWVVTAARDKTARVWDAGTGEPVGTPLLHEDSVSSAAFSPDGRWVLTASWDQSARLWNANTGEPVGAPIRHEDRVNSAVFSPDGRWLVTASDDNTARVWDASTGEPVGASLRHEDRVITAVFSHDGRWVLTASWDNSARVWDVATATVVARLRHEGQVMSAGFSPDERWVVTASGDNTARVWDAATGEPVGMPLRHGSSVTSAAFSPDGRWVVTASYDTARVWNAATGEPVGATLRHNGALRSAAFSPDGRCVVIASGDNIARVWDTGTGKPVGAPLRHERSVTSATFSPDGRWVVTASYDTARVWNAATGEPVGVPLRHEGYVNSAAFSPDGRSVLTTSSVAYARVWGTATGEPVGPPLRHELTVEKAAFSPDGRWVVTASHDNTARVWDSATGEPVGTPLLHEGSVSSAAFSPNGQWVLTASWDKTARVWDAATGGPVGAPLRHKGRVQTAAFSPDGRWVVTAAWDKTARVWDAGTGEPVGQPMRHERDVHSAAFSSDGRWVVTASWDRSVRVWDAATGEPIGAPLRHKDLVNSADFSPDGRWVVTASDDNTARVWDAATGEPVGPPLRHQDNVEKAAFSPDGQWVLTISHDHTARVWGFPVLAHGDAALADWLERAAGFRLSEAGGMVALAEGSASLTKLSEQLARFPPQDPRARQLLNWLVAGPYTRTVSPFATQTVEQRVRQLIAADTIRDLEEALEYQPGHPLALAHLATRRLQESRNYPESYFTVRHWAQSADRQASQDPETLWFTQLILNLFTQWGQLSLNPGILEFTPQDHKGANFPAWKNYTAWVVPAGLRQAAGQGDAAAQLALAARYETGFEVEASIEEAARWYRQAAETGNANAQFKLATLIRENRIQSPDSALDWFRKAAAQNSPAALFALGLLHEKGEGVTQNNEEAARWYQRVVAAGLPEKDPLQQEAERRVKWLEKHAPASAG